MKPTTPIKQSYVLLFFSLFLLSGCSYSYYREIRQHYDMDDRDWKRHLQAEAAGASMIVIKDEKLLRAPYASSGAGLYKLDEVSFEETGMRGVLSPAPFYMHGALSEKHRLSAYSVPENQREEIFNSLRVHLDINLSGDEEMIYYRDIVLTESFKKDPPYYGSNSSTSRTATGAASALVSLLLIWFL
ncbi:MAG: hypothetical protein AAGD28_01945 [Bacteroidota bacterium]